MLRRFSLKKPSVVSARAVAESRVTPPLPLALEPVVRTGHPVKVDDAPPQAVQPVKFQGDELAAIVRVQAAFRKKVARARFKRRSTFAAAYENSPLHQQMEDVQQAHKWLHHKLASSCETNLPSLVEELREFVHETSQLVSTAQTSLALRIVLNDTHHRTTRSDYLLTLADRLGPRPAHDWTHEWEALIQENFHPKKPERVGSLLQMVNLPGHSPLGAEGKRGSGKRQSSSFDIRTIMRDPSRAASLVQNEKSPSSPSVAHRVTRGDSVRLDLDSSRSSRGDSDSTRSRRDSDQSQAADDAAGRDDHSIEGWEAKPENSKQIRARLDEGWPEADAQAFELLASLRKPLAQALRAEDPRFAASTYTLCTALAEAAVRQQASELPVAPPLYRNLYGISGLANDDPAWMRHASSAASSQRLLAAPPRSASSSQPLVLQPRSPASCTPNPPAAAPPLTASRSPTCTASAG